MIPVLFIAFEFPPVNTTGMHRSAKLVKYLRDFGVDPVVLTLCERDAADAFGAPIEPGLRAELPSELSIYALAAPRERPLPRTKLGRFATTFARVEDPIARRLRPALRRVLPEIAAKHKPRAVYVSLPPFSGGGLATEIARDLALPLVVDMRDGWSHWCAGAFPSWAHWALIHRKEGQLFAAASRVVTVTRQLADIFRRSHPHIAGDRFCVVPNGFDGALDLPESLAIPPRAPDATITIGYVGNYYYTPEARESAFTPWWRRPGHRKIHYQPVREDWLYRSPFFFFRTLADLRRRSPELGRRVRFAHVGRKPPWWEAMVLEHGLSDAVSCLGLIPHAQVLATARGFDAQLCTSVRVEGGEDYALASKTFDYVLAGRPILGLVTQGAQREFLERSGMALVADPDDLEASLGALTQLARGDFVLKPDRSALAGYHRRAAAGEMAAILRQAAREAPTATAHERRIAAAPRPPDS